MSQYLVGRWGEPATWPRDPEKALLGLDAFVERNLLEDPANCKSVAFIFDYAQFLVPTSDLDSLAQGRAARLVRFLSWAQNPLIKRVNVAFVLVVDKLVELNERLVQSPQVATIEIPLPDEKEREQFVPVAAGGEISQFADFTTQQLAKVSNGLTLTNLNVVLTQAARSGKRLDAMKFRQLKKSMIERQCQGLVEIIEPKHTLELVVGLDMAKERLQQDAKWISEGQLDSAPDGLFDLRTGGNRKILSGRVLCRLDWHSVPRNAKLPIEIRRRNRRQSGTRIRGFAVVGTRSSDCGRSGRGAG